MRSKKLGGGKYGKREEWGGGWGRGKMKKKKEKMKRRYHLSWRL